MSTQATPAVRPLEAASFELRHNWKRSEVEQIYRTPLTELVFRAQTVHRQSHAPDR
jgi:biotin synthase